MDTEQVELGLRGIAGPLMIQEASWSGGASTSQPTAAEANGARYLGGKGATEANGQERQRQRAEGVVDRTG